MHWWNPEWQEWHWTMMLGMALFWIAVLVVLVFAVRYLYLKYPPPGRGAQVDAPEDILKRRYAQGDIEQEEYARRLADLRK